MLGRGPLKHKVPLLPAWFAQQKSSGRRRRRDGGCNAGMPSFLTLPSHLCPSCFAPVGVSGLTAHLRPGSFGMIKHFQMLRCTWQTGNGHPAPSAQRPGPSKAAIPPLNCRELLHDARRFTESKQGWSQVTLTPKDQAAASRGKYMPT